MSADPARLTLAELLAAGVGTNIVGQGDIEVLGVQHDSRRVVEGDLFVAVPGATHDGFDFIEDAIERGAIAVMTEREAPEPIPQLIVDDTRLALGCAAELVYGSPTSELPTVGITGTNGKTTTAYLVAEAIEGAGRKPAVMGTTGLKVGEAETTSSHTTPEGDDISRFARRALDQGASHLVLEVSSHALAMHRVDSIRFEVAAFTNLSQDHLDFHGSFEAYGAAKKRLFTALVPEHVVVHIDDPFGAALAGELDRPVIRCSKGRVSEAEVYVRAWTADRDGLTAEVRAPSGDFELRSRMLGEHNLENLLVAFGCAYVLGLDLEKVVERWASSAGSPGRLERVAHPDDVTVMVDYAHTPDALTPHLRALRPLTPKRLILVFGAGGDRDRSKRPLMGRAAAQGADLSVLTSDNPRSEDPRAIMADVQRGTEETGLARLAPNDLRDAASGFCVVVDRRQAIETAIGAACPGDTVLLAGKGHEAYQVLADGTVHFDDREEARRAIASLRRGVH